MNTSVSEVELKQAVQEQLDLILKMQQQRKALKKQNKILHQRLKETNVLVSKYHKQMISSQMNTENYDSSNTKQQVEENSKITTREEIGIQYEPESNTTLNIDNNSKLFEAQSLLKVLQWNQSRVNSSKVELTQATSNVNMQKKGKEKGRQKRDQQLIVKAKVNERQDKSIMNEVLKLTKELNITKKQFKDIQHKYKLREKEIKDLKKCLETKNEALQKSKRQFNELSNLLNNDKFKSIKLLESEVQSLRQKLAQQQEKQENGRVHQLLCEVTEQYQQYKKQSENKISILVNELADKQEQISRMKRESRKQQNMK